MHVGWHCLSVLSLIALVIELVELIYHLVVCICNDGDVVVQNLFVVAYQACVVVFSSPEHFE